LQVGTNGEEAKKCQS